MAFLSAGIVGLHSQALSIDCRRVLWPDELQPAIFSAMHSVHTAHAAVALPNDRMERGMM
jgi:hypothetical protein